MAIWTSGRWSGSCVRSNDELQTKPREWPGAGRWVTRVSV